MPRLLLLRCSRQAKVERGVNYSALRLLLQRLQFAIRNNREETKTPQTEAGRNARTKRYARPLSKRFLLQHFV